jgi:S-(hydroxymethyl)glutathione dehydrogenase/alcohol dehydrogenase
MWARTKRQMREGLSRRVEPVRIRVMRRVSVRRRHTHAHVRALGIAIPPSSQSRLATRTTVLVRGSVYGASDAKRDIAVLAGLALRGRLDLEALVTRRIGIDDVEMAFTEMASGPGARSVVCFGAVTGGR